MKLTVHLVAVFSALLVAVACQPSALPAPTTDAVPGQGPQTQPAPAATAEFLPPQAGANAFPLGDFGVSISFSYPDGFATGALPDTLAKMAIQNPGDPEYPEQARVLLTGYAGEDDSNTAPGIRVFRLIEVNAMEPAVVSGLQAVIAGTSNDHFDFPRIPAAGRTVDAQAKLVNFVNGRGYRFLVQGSYDAAALRGTHLYYIYQGITANQKFLVTVLLETDAPFIADLATGAPFASASEADAYVKTLNARINSAQPGEFSPSLDTFDQFIQSLGVVED